MSFWSSLAKIGGGLLGSAIPGGSLITGLAGGLLGGLGQSGSSTGSATSNMTGSKSSTSSGSTNQFNEAIEDPQFAAFRQALIPMMLGMVNKASEPVYTDSKIASTLADINKQFSKEDINPAMAGRGLLGSGWNDQARQDVDTARATQASQFFTQLPFLEQQAQQQNMGNALGLATGWAGKAPVSNRLTGTTSQTGNEDFSQNGQTTQTNPNGPGFMSGFANSLGGFLGRMPAKPGVKDVGPGSAGYWGG